MKNDRKSVDCGAGRPFRFALPVSFLGVLAALWVWAGPVVASTDLVEPFYTRNMNPFVQIYGLPAAEGAVLVERGHLSTRLVLDLANNFTNDTKGTEGIVIRGETYRYDLALRYGLGDKLEIGLDLPYVRHSRGHLNSFIEDWHDFFGMPQGGRDTTSDNSLYYLYNAADGDSVAVTGSASGLGDVLLSAAMPLWKSGESAARRLSVRATLKLPTGDEEDLLGSGSTDFSLRLCGEDRQTLAGAGIAMFASLGALAMTEGDVLADRQRQVVGFGSLGLGWQPLSWLALQLQLDGHSAFYDSALTQLGDFAAQLTMGGTLGLPTDFRLDVAVSEDIAVDTAPDVTFHFDLRRLF